jgi:hypothetical protein
VVKRVTIGLALYVGLFVPVYFLGGFLEGALRGLWRLTSRDLQFQFGAFVGLLGLLTTMTGLLAIPGSQLCMSLLVDWIPRDKRMLLASLLTPVFIFLTATLLVLAFAGHAFGGLFYLAFPIPFLVASAVLGLSIEWLQ